MDDYVQDFIRESEENTTELNNALLDLEDDPDDEAAMDSIFRTAHTLKGNFGAMDLSDASVLAHAIEDLLDEIREGRMAVTPAVMDLVFAGVDEIELALGQVESDGESTIDPEDTIGEIRAVIDDNAGDDAPGEASGPADVSAGPDAETEARVDVETAVASLDDPSVLSGAGDSVYHVRVGMGDSQMKDVDAVFVLEAVTESFSFLTARPDVEAIQDGDYGDGFELFVESETGPDEVEETVADIGTVETVAVSTVPGDLLASASAELDGSADADAGDADADAVVGDHPNRETAGEKPDDAGSDEIQSIRVDVSQLDDLHGLVEQLVTSRIKLRRSIEQGTPENAADNLGELDRITSSLQDTVMDMRLVPLKKVVEKFPRLVRDLARSQAKAIDFEIEGADIELDRTILNAISDPLMHLLHNAVDHGIESPAEREAAGKPREGTIHLRSRRERDRVTIEVADDGGGLDVDAIRQKAVEKGIERPDTVEEMDDSEVYDLVFHPGFSTREEVTDISGRGVGMDVVNETVTQLDGTISVDSEAGEGTTVSLTLPVTVAIVKVLFVSVGDEEYGIPIKNIDEVARLEGVETIEGEEVVVHDGTVYPLVRLGEALDVPGASANGDGILVRIDEDERQVAIHCDAVSRQEEVLVKPFEGVLSGIPGISGAAVLGEGDVVTILDMDRL